jgi:hypothetical protein
LSVGAGLLLVALVGKGLLLVGLLVVLLLPQAQLQLEVGGWLLL